MRVRLSRRAETDLIEITDFIALDNLERASELLIRQQPKAGEEDLRGFEWRHLWQLCQSDGNETLADTGAYEPVFSLDGRWLAYVSESAGRPEVYVREYAAGRWEDRVSIDGAIGPAWRADSAELYFYELSGALASVSVEPAADGRLRIGQPTRLFTLDAQRFQAYVASPDGQRFLVNLAEPGALTPPDTVIVDWQRLIRP